MSTLKIITPRDLGMGQKAPSWMTENPNAGKRKVHGSFRTPRRKVKPC